MKTHTGLKPFACTQCEYKSAFKSALKKHQLTHAKPEEKEKLATHKCDICGVSFTTGGSLTRHKISHSDKKCHKCEDCGESFGRSDNLVAHVRRCHSS